jgi:DNA-binding transcriptional ArsR family regulator
MEVQKMSANRPPACQKKAYIEIDLDQLQETGEICPIGTPIIAPTITQKVPRGKFEIAYTAELFSIMEKLGNRKIQVLSYILDNKDGNNCLNMTNSQLATAIGVSRPTVIDTVKILQDAGLVRRKNSVIMVSPHLMIKGDQIREAYIMRKFEELPPAALEDKGGAVDVEVNPQYSFTADGEIVQDAKEVRHGKK